MYEALAKQSADGHSYIVKVEFISIDDGFMCLHITPIGIQMLPADLRQLRDVRRVLMLC